jgi:hypothetical protein
MTADEVRLQTNGELLTTDSLMQMLEARVMELELVAATPWPLRLLARARLGRAIRRSVAGYGWVGPDFAGKRIQAVSDAWGAGRSR